MDVSLDFPGAFGLPLNDLSRARAEARGKDSEKHQRCPISSVDTRTEEHTFDRSIDSTLEVDAAEAVVLKEAQDLGF